MRRMQCVATGLLAAALLGGCAGLQNIKNDLTSRQGSEELKPEQVVTPSKLVPGVIVQVTYLGGAFYHLEVKNTLPGTINLSWDESVYVDTKGESTRLLYIPRKNDLYREPIARQASPPIAPNSRFQADFIGESWLDAARRGATPTPKDSSRKARLYLAFNVKSKRVEWLGEIAFVPAKKPECDRKLASCPQAAPIPQP